MWLEKECGDNVDHVLDMIHLMLEILQELESSTLEMFLVGVPMVFNIVILSTDGYFVKANVLEMSDNTSMDR